MGTRAKARRLAWRVAPGTMAERARDYERALRQSEGLTDLARRFVDNHGATVLHGPFAGLIYPRELLLAQADAPIGKLLGTYEQELHAVFDEVIDKRPPTIIDIGAAEGYYAVGLALRCQSSTVYAFELAKSGRHSCAALASLNGVQVDLRGKATAPRIRALPLDGSFVLCDIEGAEVNVLDHATTDAMRRATVVVELHERAVPGITHVLRARFSGHDCEIVRGQPRDANLPELVDGFMPEQRELAVAEERWRGYAMAWAVFRPLPDAGLRRNQTPA